jgi:hypothetical protein
MHAPGGNLALPMDMRVVHLQPHTFIKDLFDTGRINISSKLLHRANISGLIPITETRNRNRPDRIAAPISLS